MPKATPESSAKVANGHSHFSPDITAVAVNAAPNSAKAGPRMALGARTSWSRNMHYGEITTYPNAYSYGYYEIRCKLNSMGTRLNPAFWNWRSGGPVCGAGSGHWYQETDFLEALQNTIGSTNFDLTSCVHSQTDSYCGWANDNNGNYLRGDYNPPTTDSSLFSQFHTYGYEWTPGRMICYLDGVQYRNLTSPYVADSALWLVAGLGIIDTLFTPPSGRLGNSPYTNYMTIDYPNHTIDRIEIYNVVGSLMIAEKIKEKIDLSTLTSGAYILRLFNANQPIGQIKIMKQ